MTNCSTDTSAQHVAIACTPDAVPEARRAEHRARLNEIVLGKVRAGAATETGFAMRYRAQDFLELARWAELERLCCPFLTFTLRLDGDEAMLELDGPEGAKEYLASLVGG